MLRGDHVDSKSPIDSKRDLYNLQQLGVLTDTVIAVRDQQLPAHKVVLASSSGYFRALFTTKLGKHFITYLPEISGEVMNMLLDYMYLNHLEPTEANVGDILIVADYLAIDGAVHICCKYLASKLDPSNCLGIFKFARNYHQTSLQEKSWIYILKNFIQVAAEPEFLELEFDDVVKILRSNILNVRNEEKTWEAAMLWMNHKKSRKSHLVELLRSVRLGRLPPEYFLEHIRDHPDVVNSDECRPTVIETLRLLFELDVVAHDLTDKLSLELASPRYPHEVLFAIGGWSGGSPTKCVEAYDCRADKWTEVLENDPMGARAYHGTAVVNSEIYVIGGYNGFEYYNSCRCFNVFSRTWREIAPMNKSRCYVSVAVCGEFIYAMGGYNGQRRQNTAERYDHKKNQWSMVSDMHCARSDASSACLYGKIYIVGGFNGHECLSSVERYDPNENEWQIIEDMSVRRSGVSCTVYQDNLYVLGGFNGVSRMSSCERYDPQERTWIGVADMAHARSNFAVAVVDDLLMAIGGFNGTATTSDVESYSSTTQEWSVVKSLSTCRSALSACVVKDISNLADYIYQSRESVVKDGTEEKEFLLEYFHFMLNNGSN